MKHNLSLKPLFIGVFLLSIAQFVQATEGMWIPSLLAKLNESEMKSLGMKLSAEDIYSINKSSLKDAVVQFGGGCTAEIISTQGLLLTNHHCGFSQIQSHSSVKNDYLKNGFWAYNKSEELSNPGLSVTFIVRIDDVTEQVLNGSNGNNAKISENIGKITAEAIKGTKNEAFVRPFFYGNQYYMFTTVTYKDIRLVGAPPSSIGKFGGDTDNWVWPRHTGDFSMFRIYADKDNQPAEYSSDNKPFTPKTSLPISLKGVQEGDFTMVYGFPGRTQQYLPSSAIDYTLQLGNPAKIDMRTASLAIIDAAMRSSDKTRIQYAAKQSRIANAWKKWQGESRGLKQMNTLETKKAFEQEFVAAAAKKGNTSYIELSAQFQKLYADNTDLQLAYDYFVEFVVYGPEIIRFANGYSKLSENYTSNTEEQNKKEISLLSKQVEGYFKDYDAKVDKGIFISLFSMYLKGMPNSYLSTDLQALKAKGTSAITQYAENIYAKSIFTDEAKVNAFLKNVSKSSVAKLQKDPAFALSKDLYKVYFTSIAGAYNDFNANLNNYMKTYVKAMMELFPNKRYWSDANSTLRVTYGKVEGSSPADGMSYKHYTTLDGIMQKYQPGNEEFEVPEKMQSLYKAKDYGQYGQNGQLNVAFTGSNHTTGGNSGSPVINGEGQLIGLNFDRTWESTMSDLEFSPVLCRNIAVDIRYVLFVVDKYAGAKNLIAEMNLVK